jgi:hypothetical protein
MADSGACAAVEITDFAGWDDEPRETDLAAMDDELFVSGA